MNWRCVCVWCWKCCLVWVRLFRCCWCCWMCCGCRVGRLLCLSCVGWLCVVLCSLWCVSVVKRLVEWWVIVFGLRIRCLYVFGWRWLLKVF